MRENSFPKTQFKNIEKAVKAKGGDIVGVASVEDYSKYFSIDKNSMEHPFNFIDNAKSIIVIGLKMVDGILDKLKGIRDCHTDNLHSYLMNYNYNLLDYIAVQTSRYIEELGYDAYPMAARSIKNGNTLVGHFSFKKAVLAAGIGIQGKSSMIISEKYGPRVRFVVIITDLELESKKISIEESGTLCGTCRLCIDSCPVNALDFDEENKVSKVNKDKCQSYMNYCQCAYCQAVCPIGKASVKKRRQLKLL